MDGDELRQVQGPLKERYRAEPSAAVITLRAKGSLAASDVSRSVQTGRALVEAGLHPATGGDGTLACSGDLLLQALVACAGVTLRSVATNRGIDVSETVRAEGELDVRGTLSLDRTAPVGFDQSGSASTSNPTQPPSTSMRYIITTERCGAVRHTLTHATEVSVIRD